MSWLAGFRRRWILYRRLGSLQSGLWACVRHPEQTAEVARRLGLSEPELRRWLPTPDVEQPPRQPPIPLTLRAAPVAAGREIAAAAPQKRWGRKLSPPTAPSRDLVERVRKLICLLLDLPLVKEQPRLARDFVVHLARAAAYQNGHVVEELGCALLAAHRAWLSEPAEERGPLPPAECGSSSLIEKVLKLDADSGATPQSVRMQTDCLSRDVVQDEERGSDTGGEREEGAGVPEDIPATGEHWDCLRALLETVHGHPDLALLIDESLQSIESHEEAADPGANAARAPEDLLLIVRSRLHEITLQLAAHSHLSRPQIEEALGILARRSALPFRHLRWALEQGPSGEGRPAGGRRLPPDVDVKWALLARLALARLPYSLKGPGPKIEWLREQRRAAPIVELAREDAPSRGVVADRITVTMARVESSSPLRVFHLLTEGLAAIMGFGIDAGLRRTSRAAIYQAPAPPRRGDTWCEEIGRLLASEAAAVDPDLAVQLAGALAHDQGLLTWETCLRLANSRARHHCYLEEGATPAQWDVRLEVQPRADGTIAIPFSVVQQPLSRRFRRHFEAADLQGRIQILWHLVHYARDLRASIRSLGETDVHRQIALREDELLARVGAHA